MSGDTKSALLNFEKAESFGAVNADTKEILLKRLQIYVESQDFVNAENYAVQLKLLAPSEFRSYQIYFQILTAVGKYDKAEEVLAEAEKYADVESDILNKADVYFDKAMLCAVKADKDPEHAAGYYEEAVKIFEELEAVPDLPALTLANIAFTKAEIYLKLEWFDDALQCAESIPDNEETGERADFIRLSCYFGKEDYDKADEYAEKLKQSANEYYVYFATYADAFAAKKLAGVSDAAAALAKSKYNNAVAFFKNKSFEKPQDVFSVIFRVRLYAENGRFFKAEELIKLMPETLRTELNKYMADCRRKLEKE
jgi:tetratricopeptide (TPR) repeat protein